MEAFDHLQPEQVVWEPYRPELAAVRTGGRGLSYLCHRDKVYWMTKKKLVHDMVIQDYAVHRCLQQFGLRQEFPMPFANWVPRYVALQTLLGSMCIL